MTEEVKLKRYEMSMFGDGMREEYDGSYVDYYDAMDLLEHKDARIADLERQLAEETTWRSPETAPRDGRTILISVLVEKELAVWEAWWDGDFWNIGGQHIDHSQIHSWLSLPKESA